jgi:hypothetical protein
MNGSRRLTSFVLLHHSKVLACALDCIKRLRLIVLGGEIPDLAGLLYLEKPHREGDDGENEHDTEAYPHKFGRAFYEGIRYDHGLSISVDLLLNKHFFKIKIVSESALKLGGPPWAISISSLGYLLDLSFHGKVCVLLFEGW